MHIVSRFAERKHATLPALASILIVAGDDGIKLRATNLETGIDYKVRGECETDGVVAIPATVLQQIASSFSGEGDVRIEHTGDTVSITTGTSRSLVKTTPHEDFPLIPMPERTENSMVVPGHALRAVISSVGSCASSSTVRPELASLYFTIQNATLTIVATDSFRLAEKKIPIGNTGLQGKFLIPAKNALEIAQALPDSEVTIIFDEHQCAFVSEEGTMVSRLTNATYPDYQQIIPKEHVAEAVVLRKDLELALKRTTIFSDAFSKVLFEFDPKKNALALFAKNSEVGESTESLLAKVSGVALTISFNHRFIATVFGLTNADSVTLTASGIGRPLIMRGVGDNSLLYLISPMNQ